MRIIGGSARGRKLTTCRGNEIRPTTDRVREALFSILVSKLGTLSGLKVLDLFAGSGALGIEALSRGADHAWFVDRSPSALATIRKNLELCGFTAQAILYQADVLAGLPGEVRRTSFDLAFLDPPYGGDHVTMGLKMLVEQVALTEQGLIIVEAGSRDSFRVQTDCLEEIDRRRYGSSALHFYRRIAHEP